MLLWKLWECLTIPTKIILSIYSKLSCLSVGKKSTSPPNSFTRCCKRNRKTCYFGKFKHAWPHTPKMIIAIWRNLWHLSVRKRSLSSFMLSLRYYKDIVNLLFWVLWACLAVQTQRDTITFRKLSFLLGGKKSTSPNPHTFLQILQRYANYSFRVLSACLVAHTQNDSTNLKKIWMFICMPKIYFIFLFFLEILHFQECCNLIGWQHFGP